MPTYCFYAPTERTRRPDGINTVVASGADAAAARAVAEQLIAVVPGTLADFAAVDLFGAPAFAVQGHPPVGSRTQSTWPRLGRGGDPLLGS